MLADQSNYLPSLIRNEVRIRLTNNGPFANNNSTEAAQG